MIAINTETEVTSITEQTTEMVTDIQHIVDPEVVVDAFTEKAEETANIFTRLSAMLSAKMPSIVFALIVMIVGIVISKIIIKAVSKTVLRANINETANGFLHSFLSAILYSVTVIIALNVIGVPMASMITVIGAAGLALSLSLQQCLSNVAGGFIILFSKPFKVGDFIEINGVSGEVEGISILYTKILTPDNKLSYIPNGSAANDKIINYTVMKSRRLDLIYSISYDSDFRLAQSLINTIVAENAKALKTPEPIVRMSAHNSSSIDIDVKVWVKSEDYFDLKYDITEKVKEVFDENGIVIPFTTINVNM